MPNYTPNYNLKKPLGNENYNVADQNGNMDIIDAQMKTNADAINTHKAAAVLDHPDGSVTDAKIGDRTINQTTAPNNTGKLTALLSGIANMIKAITGKSDWKTAPVKSLEALNNEKAPIANPNFTGTVSLDGKPLAVAGNSNTDVNKTKAITLQVDTRTLVLTYTGEQLTKIEEKDGTTAVKTTILGYNGDGTLGTVTETAGGTTVTKNLTYTSGKLSSVTKAVV